MKPGCLFCEIYRKKAGIIYENDYFYSEFDICPVTPGHALVIPKGHLVSLLGLDDKEWVALKPAIQETIKVIESSDLKQLYTGLVNNPPNEKSKRFCQQMLNHIGINKKPDGYNIGNNEGEAAGRTIHHLHIHIIPRYLGDVEDLVGGIRQVISGRGNYRR